MAARTADLVVVGGGIFGLATALEAGRRGRRVVLLDRGTLPAPDAASTNPSRKIKSTYRDPAYARLGLAAMAGWQRIERDVGAQLLVRLGNLVIATDSGDPRLDEQASVSEAAGGVVQRLDERDLRSRYPVFRLARSAIFEPAAGFVRATEAVGAVRRLAEAAGVAIVERANVERLDREGERPVAITVDGRTFAGKQLVVAAGGWSRALVPELRELITLRRAGVAYVSGIPPAFEAASMPPFSVIGTNHYGFPRWRDDAAKFGWHDGAEAIDDADLDRSTASSPFRAGIERLLVDHFGLDPGGLTIEWESCLYDVSPASDFLVDAVPGAPGVFVACGSSGHGFKFGSVIGRIVMDRVDGNLGTGGWWPPQFGWKAAFEARGRAVAATPI